MGLTIIQKADTLGTFRFVLVRFMETLAAWVPTSPELEVKTLFGRHLWQLAQHADAIGHRTIELRAKLHYERPPHQNYLTAVRLVQDLAGSGDRIAAFYDGVLPDLASRLSGYLAQTDELLDAPTVEIFRRVLGDFERMQADRAKIGAQRPDIAADSARVDRIKQALAAAGELVEYREGVAP